MPPSSMARRSPAALAALFASSTLTICPSSGCARDPDAEFFSHVTLLTGCDHEGDTDHEAPGHIHAERDGVAEFNQPLVAPEWVDANAATHMRPDDPVLGYVAGDEAWAIPWWILKNHHVANITVGGESLLLTLCERCSSAAAYDARVHGQPRTFGVRGLYNGTHILADVETDTFWTPFLGEAMNGPDRGLRLERRRLDQATWVDWLELHPQSMVAFGTPEMRLGHGSEDSPGSPGLGGRMRSSILHVDERLPENQLVLGVVIGELARAYPLPRLEAAGPLLVDRLGEQALVVLHKPGTWLAAAFKPEARRNQPLTFRVNDAGAIIDGTTGSRWSVAGIAKEGPLAGQVLDPVQYSLEEWYIWAAQHPQTSITEIP